MCSNTPEIETTIFFKFLNKALGKNLSPSSKKIILSDNALIQASAGSGKTMLVSLKAIYLILLRKIHGSQILIMTFTNSGVKEIKSRINELLEDVALRKKVFSLPTIITYNSYAQQIIAKYSKENYYMLSPLENSSLIKDFVGKYDLECKFLDLNSGDLVERIEKFEYTEEQWTLNQDWLSLLLSEESTLGGLQRRKLIEIAKRRREFLLLYRALVTFKNEKGFLSFDDQVRKARELLRAREVLEKENWKGLILDEYQDTSILHDGLIRSLTKNQKLCSVLCVGDKLQSIFQWSNPGFNSIDLFCKRYTRERLLRSSTKNNYRSERKIITLVNTFTKNYLGEASKGSSRMIAKKKCDPTSKISFIDTGRELQCFGGNFFDQSTDCQNHQYCNILSVLQNKLDRVEPCAVLFRKNIYLEGFYKYLSRSNTFRVANCFSYFLEASEELVFIKSLIRLLFVANDRFIINSMTSSLLRGFPYFFRENAIDSLLRRYSKSSFEYLYEFLLNTDDLPIRYEYREELEAFKTLFSELLHLKNRDTDQIFQSIIFHTKLDEKLIQDNRERVLEFLYELLSNFKGQYLDRDIGDFCDYLDNRDKLDSIYVEGGGTFDLELSTVHKAKGKEWNTVCIPNLSYGNFLLKYRRASFLTNYSQRIDSELLELLKSDLSNAIKKIDERELPNRFLYEELKLVYVALTRARENLVIGGRVQEEPDIFGFLYKNSKELELIS
jgi:superfamily I DNA/RNA helicase